MERLELTHSWWECKTATVLRGCCCRIFAEFFVLCHEVFAKSLCWPIFSWCLFMNLCLAKLPSSSSSIFFFILFLLLLPLLFLKVVVKLSFMKFIMNTEKGACEDSKWTETSRVASSRFLHQIQRAPSTGGLELSPMPVTMWWISCTVPMETPFTNSLAGVGTVGRVIAVVLVNG